MKTVTCGISSAASGGSAAPFATEAPEECSHCLQLQSRIKDLQMQVIQLRRQIEYWTKRFHGRMSEKRHLPLDPAQLLLPFPAEGPGRQPCGAAEWEHTGNPEPADVAEAPGRRHPVRRRLDTTALEVVETHLWPDGTTDSDGRLLESYDEVGTETTDLLECIPASIYISRIIRHKVVARAGADRSILTPPLPKAAIDKGMAGATLLAAIILDKYLYHMPFHRQIDRYRQYGLRLPAATVSGWYEAAVDSLHLLYRLLREKVMASQYIQTDESTVPVVDNDRHRTRKGYQWCVRDGITGALFFWYDRGSRSKNTARELLGGYRGTFQSDGYEAYDQFCGIAGVRGAACWAHVRRKFVEALREDRSLATEAIRMIGQLYAVEKEADAAAMTPEQRALLRKQKAYPVIVMIEKWCFHTYPSVLAKSLLGKAIAYTYSLIERLGVYIYDGRVNIDNNLIENAIRPLALGRKNWLFCGNDASACRAAIVYSMIASCKAADVDPRQWLEYVLLEIPFRKKNRMPLDDLLPAAYAAGNHAGPWNIPDTQ